MALPALDGSVLAYSFGFTPDPPSAAATTAALAKVSGALAPYQAGHRYYNLAETDVDPSAFFDRHTFDRLRRVKKEYDPGNLFRARHEIGPAQDRAPASKPEPRARGPAPSQRAAVPSPGTVQPGPSAT